MSLLAVAGANSAVAAGYDIDYSVKNEDANGERFQSGSWFTNYSSTKTFTYSMWVKRTDLTTGTNYLLQYQYNTGVGFNFGFAADSSTQALYYLLQTSGTVYAYGKTTALYRDTSAWYHIVWRVDTTQATAADRIRIYVNGVQQDLESGGGGHPVYPSQNYDAPLQTTQYVLGAGGTGGFCGYCADYYFIDGQSLAPTDFGEFDSATGIWKPIEYQGTFGNEGYYLDFADSTALGKDVSPNNQGTFSHYGGSSVDQATDTPTNNFCLINTLQPADQTVIYGATIWSNTVSNSWRSSVANTGVNNGKWYYEITIDTGGYNMVGITGENGINTLLGTYLGASANATNASYGYLGNGVIYNNAGQPTTGLPTFSGGDIISIALDMDNGYVYFAKNGSWVNSGDPTSGSSGTGGWALYDSSETQFFASSIYGSNDTLKYNFGGFYYTTISTAETDANGYGTFEYAPPSGYYALCSKNLAEYG